MKYLSHYTEKATTEALNKAGAFFAFSTEQLNEQKQPNTKYYNLGAGLLCPTTTSDQLIRDMKQATENGRKLDMEENGKENIIKRELANCEAYYTNDITETVKHLKPYGITHDEVLEVYRATAKDHDYSF